MLLAAAAGLGLAGCSTTGRAPDPGGAPVPAGAREGVQRLLAGRSHALRSGDVTALLAGIDPRAAALARAQEAAATAVTGVGVAQWSAEVLRLRRAPRRREEELGAPAVLADVAIRERLDGEDAVVRRAAHLTVVDRGGSWLLASTADGPTTPALWDLGPVRAARSGRSLVVAAASAPEWAEEVPAVLDEAAARVDEAWGTGWPRRTAVLVPATAADAARLLHRDPAWVAPLAALAVGDASVPGSGVRVLVQPEQFGRLSATGRAVVLTHELVHVAARTGLGLRGTGSLPLWLVEGAADQLARSGRGLDPAELARPLLQRVAAGMRPTVPTDAELRPGGGAPLDLAYAAAWTLCESIARRHGAGVLVELQRRLAVPGAPDVSALAPAVLGEDLPAAEERWRAEVHDGLAGWR
ncbi:hypothetical protein CLV92_106111 [Kineococcus xinjiangensis]|uniref:Peptidase MA superfamily protein n=1 Tax=Kineococcus xinjiangensis TaxID=512762 RepID=A0A2S6IMC7_9ACTN|nr:hypothetical protein CLV92_106111 [Kineococcus xinjiangensis]